MDQVWISARKINGSYQWPDGTALEYTNWFTDKSSNDSNRDCVGLSAEVLNRNNEEVGQWIDVHCDGKRNIIACQKQREWTTDELRDMVMNLKNEQNEIYKALVNEISNRKLEGSQVKSQLDATNGKVNNLGNQLGVLEKNPGKIMKTRKLIFWPIRIGQFREMG